MDDDARAMEVFMDVQRGLPRQGPGHDDATRRATRSKNRSSGASGARRVQAFCSKVQIPLATKAMLPASLRSPGPRRPEATT